MKPQSRDTTRPLAKAWWSLALFLPSVATAFLVGEGIPGMFGWTEPSSRPAWWVLALALGVSTLILASPLLLTARYSAKASRVGVAGAWLPVIVGSAIVFGFVGINLSSGILVLIG
ncbi:hypothetical protein ACH3VR_07645 [Microbacterium sp. B2969]|uniref:Uncharacterized protein n=1 Tax=Microbacterium alkaliflavum TaxID=3248839 RepID=A0ABW7Q7L3_9MICO